MRNWAQIIATGTELGFEFWGIHTLTIYRHGQLVAENVDFTEARQLVIRAVQEVTK